MRKPFAIAATLAAVAIPSASSAQTVQVTNATELESALRAASAGDSIVLDDGSYAIGATIEAVLTGTFDAPITIEAAAGARPILQGPADAATLQLTAAFTTIQGLEFAGSGTGIALVGDTVDLRDLVFSGGTSGVRCDDCSNLLLVGSEFAGTGPGPAFDGLLVESSDLAGNYVHDVQGPGIRVQGVGNRVYDNVVVAAVGDGVAVADPSAGAVGNSVNGNFLRGAGIFIGGAGTVQNNIIWEATATGITSQLSDAGVVDVFILHNTVVDAPVCFGAVDWPLSAGITVVANNAFYCPTGAATLFESGVGQNTIVTSNVYLGTSDFPGDSVLGSGVQNEFEDAANGNFYPAQDSLLVDAGDPNYLVALDYNGAGRSVPPDIGAYERGQGTNPFPNPGDGFKSPFEPPPGGDTDAGGSDPDAGPGGGGGGPSGSAPEGSVGAGEGYSPREDGCQCGSAGNPGSPFLFLLIGVALALPRLRKRSTA